MPRKKGQRKKASERKPRNKHERKAAESRLRREKQKRKAPGDAEEIKISKYFGVYWEKTGWVARFVANGQLYVWPDTFETELEAAHAVNNGCDILGIKRKIPSIDRKIDQKTSKNKNDEVGRNITEKQRKPKPPYIKTREPLPEEKPIKPKKSDGPVSCEYCGEDSSSKRLHFNKERTMKLCFACYSYEWTNGFLVPRVDRNGSRKSKRAAIENAGNEESESVESDSDESETDQSSSDESDTKEADIFRADMDVDDLNEKGESKVQKEASEMKSGNKEVEHFKVKEKKLWKKRKGSSNYFGVSWHSGKGKWQAQFKHEGFTRWCGAYSKELCAARAINRKCDEYGIPHKNPGIGAEDTTVMQVAVESSDDDEIFTVTKRQFSRMKGKGSSKYLGVSWYAKNGKWRAQFRVEGEIIWCGWHTSELDAVRAINKKCDELGIEPRNVYTGTTKSTESATELDEAHGANRKCDELEIGRKNQDTGHPSLKSHVHLDRDEDKTICQYHGCLQESANGRLYKSTMTDSLLCVACKRYEERTGFLTPRAQRNKGRPKDMRLKVTGKKRRGAERKSKYRGVSWHSGKRKWQAHFKVDGKKYWCGTYACDLEAARSVNRKCYDIGIAHMNPNIEEFPLDKSKPVVVKLPEAMKIFDGKLVDSENKKAIEKNKISSKFGFTARAAKQSSYVAVYWNKTSCKWRACFNHAQKTYYCGTFHSELEAAHSTNRKCDELGITRKNASIGTPKFTSLNPNGESEEEESSSASEEMSGKIQYTIEHILSKRKLSENHPGEYFVKWFGLPANESSWEPISSHSTPRLLEEFENRWRNDKELLRKILASKKCPGKFIQLRPGASPNPDWPLRIAIYLKEHATASEIENIHIAEEVFLMPNGHVVSTSGWHEPPSHDYRSTLSQRNESGDAIEEKPTVRKEQGLEPDNVPNRSKERDALQVKYNKMISEVQAEVGVQMLRQTLKQRNKELFELRGQVFTQSELLSIARKDCKEAHKIAKAEQEIAKFERERRVRAEISVSKWEHRAKMAEERMQRMEEQMSTMYGKFQTDSRKRKSPLRLEPPSKRRKFVIAEQPGKPSLKVPDVVNKHLQQTQKRMEIQKEPQALIEKAHDSRDWKIEIGKAYVHVYFDVREVLYEIFDLPENVRHMGHSKRKTLQERLQRKQKEKDMYERKYGDILEEMKSNIEDSWDACDEEIALVSKINEGYNYGKQPSEHRMKRIKADRKIGDDFQEHLFSVIYDTEDEMDASIQRNDLPAEVPRILPICKESTINILVSGRMEDNTPERIEVKQEELESSPSIAFGKVQVMMGSGWDSARRKPFDAVELRELYEKHRQLDPNRQQTQNEIWPDTLRKRIFECKKNEDENEVLVMLRWRDMIEQCFLLGKDVNQECGEVPWALNICGMVELTDENAKCSLEELIRWKRQGTC